MKYLFFFITLLLNFQGIVCFAQTSPLVITPQIKLPTDSLTKSGLIKSLEQFLRDKNQDMSTSNVVDKAHYNQYRDFFDIYKNIERNKKYNDTSFYRCYLTNVVLQPDHSYQISLAFYGISPDKEVINRLRTTMIAKKEKDSFKFYCPFERNVQLWKSQKIGNITFFYKDQFNKKIAQDFEQFNSKIATKLKIEPMQFKYYNCKDVQEIYSLMGIDYDMSRNGEVRSGSFDLTHKVFLSGTNTEQYKHDLTHAYFGLKFPNKVRNWTAEEGYNVYTTDFWGETTEQNFQYVKDFIKANPNTTLLSAFEKDIYLKYPIPIKYPLSALIMRKVEREYGFEKVLELIDCGGSDEHYFKKLKEITGITQETFEEVLKTELQNKKS
jgi:hypothetical protein